MEDQEKILLNQLAVWSMMNVMTDNKSESLFTSDFNFQLPENTLDVLTMCDSVLMRLLQTQSDGALVHEMSRYPTIFPSLHSILCATISALFLVGIYNRNTENMGGDNLQKVKKLQAKLCVKSEKLISADQLHSSLHPSILSALQVLKSFDRGYSSEQPVKSDIEKLLFLLK